ncbi:MAG: TetR/AcrR family transcriptional regulator [Flavobacteriaceae bacterium]|nr:TetR/AcrR family transcriptional regulator [Flavobacteriaceae bacterium]
MEKNEFIKKVTPFFVERGFKTLTVDEIGREFSMSKKTIYNMFSSKKEIVGLSFDHVLDKYNHFFKFSSEHSDNAVEAFFTLLCLINSYFPYDKQRLNLRQMEYYYRKLFDEKMASAQELAKAMFTKFCTKGRLQGLVREDFNLESQAHLFSVLYIHLLSTNYLNPNENYDRTIMDNIEISIRGVLTMKGFEAFEIAKETSKSINYKNIILDNCL